MNDDSNYVRLLCMATLLAPHVEKGWIRDTGSARSAAAAAKLALDAAEVALGMREDRPETPPAPAPAQDSYRMVNPSLMTGLPADAPLHKS